MKIVLYRHKLNWPPEKEPFWGKIVERWYQLDAAAYSLVETYSILEKNFAKKPFFLILASPLGSMETDFLFARSGASSPSKFVHTLSNIRGSSLMQVMDWQGPLICFQNDPITWLTGLNEAIDLSSDVNHEIWVIHFKKTNEEGVNEVIWAQILYDSLDKEKTSDFSQVFLIVSPQMNQNVKLSKNLKDGDFWLWISDASFSSPLMISDRWSLQKTEL